MQPIDAASRAESVAESLVTDPHGTLAALREESPVHRITGPDGRPAWLVTRHGDVRSALADPRFSLDKRNALPGHYSGFSLPPALDANLLNMDPPDHTRVRRLVVRAFTPGRVEKLRGPVRAIADGLLDAVEPGGRTDLLTTYAGRLPLIVICELLGVPEEDRPDFRSWVDALLTPDPERPHLMKEAVVAMTRFFTGLVERKRAEPADDLLSDLVRVRDDEGEDGKDGEEGDGRGLSRDELTSLAFLVVLAGYEPTVHLIGNTVLALLDRPALLRRVRTDPDGLAAAVDEVNRWDGPYPMAIRRFPVEDVEIGGVTVPKGETVLLSLAAANRDPRRFPEPDRLDLDRDRSGHLAMGHGIHHCLAAPLARMEAVIALEVLLNRFEKLELDVPRAELRWRPSMRARGLISLPVRW
ncbi:cytochrome P450 [Streptomyces mashuensis]|uniref:Cytochrome P450 n=1 Tax=Streptomyces mashuensis TaxID=33904 RepID=A0A919AY83_9ACTN|nr:cytochrome P450 [Streptomyces mashuensis]GHF29140.1 cytochrome P450 [Streptomyces mashuensis]